MNKRRFIGILRRYRRGTASSDEVQFIEQYCRLYDMESEDAVPKDADERRQLKQAIKQGIWERIYAAESDENRVKKMFPRFFTIAAAIILILGSGLLLYMNLYRKSGNSLVLNGGHPYHNDVKPGGTKAVLTLAGGRKIVLDNAPDGSLATQGSVDVVKRDSGALVYKSSSTHVQAKPVFNQMYIPLGGEFKIVLADGTKVWLNAGTTLTYPTAFTGKERHVFLDGEAYFEVAKDTKVPFVVTVDSERIQVLGTSFNVQAYHNDPAVKTTLVDGAVKVLTSAGNRVLNPGEQARFDAKAAHLQVAKVNVDEALAWKNGLFEFNRSNIKTIMREVERWYNVAVQYQATDLDKKDFTGVVSRYSNVSKLLNRLEMTGVVHFNVEGRVITVMD